MRLAALELCAAAAILLQLAACALRCESAQPSANDEGERLEAPTQGPSFPFRPFRPAAGSAAQGSASKQAEPPDEQTYQSIRRVPGGYALDYGFKNFNGDALRLQARLDEKAVADSIREFGFREEDLRPLDAWRQEARANAIAGAKTQAELDRRLSELSAEYLRRRTEFYRRAGFRFVGDKVIAADVPALARRNAQRMGPVARTFSSLAQARRYGSEELVGAVAAMAQTALRYVVPPDRTQTDRVIGGILPPPEAMILGEGDCDTKTALIASILRHWPNLRLVGLEIPEHYLMAVQRSPRKGEVYIEHEGFPYVMIESAGPAWIPPGEVGEFTLSYLESGRQFRIQPL